MLERDDILNFLQDNLDYLKEHFYISKIALFGSFSRNEQNDNSDIDILVDFRDDIKNIYEVKRELKEFLSSSLHKDIDLAREKYLKPYAKRYILKEAIYV